MRIRLSLMLISFALAACASQSGSSGSSGTVDVGNGCKVNATEICANVRGKSVDMSGTGLSADQRMVEQNSGHTADIFIPIKMPDGSSILEVHCGINAQKQSVVYAQVKTGPPMPDERVKYLRAQGLCTED